LKTNHLATLPHTCVCVCDNWGQFKHPLTVVGSSSPQGSMLC
jgi:hypothetical protein